MVEEGDEVDNSYMPFDRESIRKYGLFPVLSRGLGQAKRNLVSELKKAEDAAISLGGSALAIPIIVIYHINRKFRKNREE